MKRKYLLFVPLSAFCLVLTSCKNQDSVVQPTTVAMYKAVETTFKGKIDLNNLQNYSNQVIPAYITKDNTNTNPITDAGATLGRVLFYDKKLSINNSVSCSSCHKQAMAFGSNDIVSGGVNGNTLRHTMRLVNARFSDEVRFFWDKRAFSLEDQTTQPVRNHNEMGFSGQNGDPGIDSLINKLSSVDYYQELFTFVYGSPEITETKIQDAIAQFVRSIQSFDSKYDEGRAQVNNDNAPFPNFSQQENQGKNLFTGRPQFDQNGVRTGGGAGCDGCHRAPEFDIDPRARNNGVTAVANNPSQNDYTNTKAPSLRNIFNPGGNINGLLMHNGAFRTFDQVLNHYNSITIDPQNNNLDRRLTPAGRGQQLRLTQQERDALTAFLKTLTGTDVYTNAKWSDPFN